MDGIDFLYKHLGHKLAHEFRTEIANDEMACDCCGRARSEWYIKDRCVKGKYSDRNEIHCLSCQALYHGSFDCIGFEGIRGKGSPTSLKIGILGGCGLLLSEQGSVLYAPGKHHEKLVDAPSSIFDEIVKISGNAMVRDALGRKPKKPFLLIENFGLKKADLVRHLEATTTSDFIQICSVTGSRRLPSSFVTFSDATDRLPKKVRSTFLTLLERSTSRYLSVDEAKQFTGIVKEDEFLTRAVKNLPTDPHLKYLFARLAKV